MLCIKRFCVYASRCRSLLINLRVIVMCVALKIYCRDDTKLFFVVYIRMIQNRIWNNWELRCLSTFKIHAVPECRVFLLSCRYVYKPEENTFALQPERFVYSHCVVLVHHTEHNFEHFCLSYFIFRDQCFIQI